MSTENQGTQKGSREDPIHSNRVKDPEAWTTGQEPMTGAQRSYLHTLTEGTDEKIDDNMTKAEASERIEALHTLAQKRNGQDPDAGVSNTVKNPSDWKTGDEEMTGAQRSYLKTLSDEAGEDMQDNLTKAEASRRIDELQRKTGRGREK